MISLYSKTLVFLFFSLIQLRIADAKDYAIPTELPKECVKSSQRPCAISTGDEPRMFLWSGNAFELGRNLVLQTKKAEIWDVYSGLLVVNSKNPVQIHTPFADVYLGQSKVMIHVLDKKVRVLSLAGEGVRVRAKGDPDEAYLVPGFQNWYGGVIDGEPASGVASVIDIHTFAKQRADFFLDHSHGYMNELRQLARTIKWAAQMAARMHRELIERKMASLEQKHQHKVLRKKRKVQYNKFLRWLFLRKINYDE